MVWVRWYGLGGMGQVVWVRWYGLGGMTIRTHFCSYHKIMLIKLSRLIISNPLENIEHKSP